LDVSLERLAQTPEPQVGAADLSQGQRRTPVVADQSSKTHSLGEQGQRLIEIAERHVRDPGVVATLRLSPTVLDRLPQPNGPDVLFECPLKIAQRVIHFANVRQRVGFAVSSVRFPMDRNSPLVIAKGCGIVAEKIVAGAYIRQGDCLYLPSPKLMPQRSRLLVHVQGPSVFRNGAVRLTETVECLSLFVTVARARPLTRGDLVTRD